MEKFQKIHEFDTFHGTYFIPPMVKMYRDTLLSIDKNWTDSQTWGLYRSQLDMREISMTVYLMADDDTKVFQNAFRQRLEKYGSREGLLRCAIGFPDEFALMRSFFEDTAALEKWIWETPFLSEKGFYSISLLRIALIGTLTDLLLKPILHDQSPPAPEGNRNSCISRLKPTNHGFYHGIPYYYQLALPHWAVPISNSQCLYNFKNACTTVCDF